MQFLGLFSMNYQGPRIISMFFVENYFQKIILKNWVTRIQYKLRALALWYSQNAGDHAALLELELLMT